MQNRFGMDPDCYNLINLSKYEKNVFARAFQSLEGSEDVRLFQEVHKSRNISNRWRPDAI